MVLHDQVSFRWQASLNSTPEAFYNEYFLLFVHKTLRKTGQAWNMLNRSNFYYETSQKEKNLSQLVRAPRTVAEVFKMSSKHYFVNALRNCNKVAYIDTLSNVSKVYEELMQISSVQSENLQISIESLDTVYSAARLFNFPQSLAYYVWRRMAVIFEAGLAETIRDINESNVTLKHRQMSTFQSVSMKGNFSTTFYMLLIFIGVAGATCLLEKIPANATPSLQSLFNIMEWYGFKFKARTNNLTSSWK